MECTRYRTDGMRLLDGELSPPEQAEYEAHVRGCDACQRELDPLGRVENVGEPGPRIVERHQYTSTASRSMRA